MPTKGMRSIFFRPKAPSFTFSPHSSPSRGSISFPTPPRTSTSSASSISDTIIDEIIENAAALITKWNPESSQFGRITSLFHESKTEANHFIKTVTDLQRAMRALVSDDPTSVKLVDSQKLMQIAMKRLQKEFYQILSTNRAHLDPESVSSRSRSSRANASNVSNSEDEDEEEDEEDSISKVEQASSVVMDDLKSIAECMIASGYAKECVHIYNLIRKSIVDEAMYKLGVERLSSSQISKMDGQVMEMKIKRWLNGVKVSMTTLFAGERILCDHVFAVSKTIRQSCFDHITKDGASLLFGFPQLLASKTKKNFPEEMVFRFLDMYTAISENWPEIESIFGYESTAAARSEALNSLIKLGVSIRTMLLDYETLIQKDTSKTPIAGGGVHPLTHRVMSYLAIITDYSNVLVDIFIDWSPPAKLPLPESEETSVSSISLRMVWLILVLVCKLDEKAKLYKDVAVSYLFLSNNLQHIISEVKSSNLQYLLGDEWVSRHEEKVLQFAANYERLAWDAVLSSLPEFVSVEMTWQEARLVFRNFNFALEETYRKEKMNVVADAKLREQIKASVTKKVVKVYKEFYDVHRVSVGSVRNAAMYVRFKPEDVAHYLSNLF